MHLPCTGRQAVFLAAFILALQPLGCRAGSDIGCWGSNSDGQSEPTAHSETNANLQGTSCSDTHCCAWYSTGSVSCWGSDVDGRSSPPSGLIAAGVACASQHCCAWPTAGDVTCWGSTADGRSSPPSGTVAGVSCGTTHCCSWTAAGSVSCWGSDVDGQATPTPGLTDVVKVTCSAAHSCALTSAGAVDCWGADNKGQATPPAGLGTITDVSCASEHCCLVDTAGSVTCWGETTAGRSLPPKELLPVAGLSCAKLHCCSWGQTEPDVTCWGYFANGRTNPPGGIVVDFVTCGEKHCCASVIHTTTTTTTASTTSSTTSTITSSTSSTSTATTVTRTTTSSTTLSTTSTTSTTATTTSTTVSMTSTVTSTTSSSSSSSSSTHTTSVTSVTSSTTTTTSVTVTSITITTSSSSSTSSTSSTATSTTSATSTTVTTSTSSSTTTTSRSRTSTATSSTTTTQTSTQTTTSVTSTSVSSTTSHTTTATTTTVTMTTITTATITTADTTTGTTATATYTTYTGTTERMTSTYSTTTSTSSTAPPPTDTSTRTTSTSATSTATSSTATSSTATTSTATSSTATTSTATSSTATSRTTTTKTTTTSTTPTSTATTNTATTTTSTATTTTSTRTTGTGSTFTATDTTTTATVTATTTTDTATTATSTSAAATVAGTSITATGTSITATSTVTTATATTTTITTATGAEAGGSTTNAGTGETTTTRQGLQTTTAGDVPPSGGGGNGTTPANGTEEPSSPTTTVEAVGPTTADPNPLSDTTTVEQTFTTPPVEGQQTTTIPGVAGTTSTNAVATPTQPTQQEQLQDLASQAQQVAASTVSLLSQNNVTSVVTSVDSGPLAGTTITTYLRSPSGPPAETDTTVMVLSETTGEPIGASVTVPASVLNSFGSGDPATEALAASEGVVMVVTLLDATPESVFEALGVVSIEVLTAITAKHIQVGDLAEPIKFQMPVNYTEGAVCYYWDEAAGQWSDEKVRISADNVVGSPVTCETFHLSFFAVFAQAFLAAIGCGGFSLISEAGVRQIFIGQWYELPAAILYWCISSLFLLLFLAATLADCKWRRTHTWSNSFFLIPVKRSADEIEEVLDEKPENEDPQPGLSDADVKQGLVTVMCCQAAACCLCIITFIKESPLAEAIDEVVSNWFDQFADIRACLDGICASLDISSLSMNRCLPLGFHVMGRLLLNSSRRGVATAMFLSEEVINFVLDDEDLQEFLQDRRKKEPTEAEDASTVQEGSGDAPVTDNAEFTDAGSPLAGAEMNMEQAEEISETPWDPEVDGHEEFVANGNVNQHQPCFDLDDDPDLPYFPEPAGDTVAKFPSALVEGDDNQAYSSEEADFKLKEDIPMQYVQQLQPTFPELADDAMPVPCLADEVKEESPPDPKVLRFRQETWRTHTEKEMAWLALRSEIEDLLKKTAHRHGRVWCKMPALVAMHLTVVNPMGGIMVLNIFSSCKMRALFLIMEMSGALMVTCLFFSSTGAFAGVDASGEACDIPDSVQSTLAYQMGRAAAIAIGSLVLAKIPVNFIQSLHTLGLKKVDYEGSPQYHRQLRKWKVQDRMIWVLGSLYVAWCHFYMVLFVANLLEEEQSEFTLSSAVAVVQELIVIPLFLALMLPLAVGLLLSCNSLANAAGHTALISRVLDQLHSA